MKLTDVYTGYERFYQDQHLKEFTLKLVQGFGIKKAFRGLELDPEENKVESRIRFPGNVIAVVHYSSINVHNPELNTDSELHLQLQTADLSVLEEEVTINRKKTRIIVSKPDNSYFLQLNPIPEGFRTFLEDQHSYVKRQSDSLYEIDFQNLEPGLVKLILNYFKDQ